VRVNRFLAPALPTLLADGLADKRGAMNVAGAPRSRHLSWISVFLLLACASSVSVASAGDKKASAPAVPSSAPVASSTAARAPAPTPTLTAKKLTLENGLTVLLHEDHQVSTVSVNVFYHVGSKDEAPGKNGFAHLFEHVMFQGSKHVAEDTFFRHLEEVGASGINGTTNTDRTNYFETVPSNRLELALWLESDRMGFLLDHVDQATFDGQREVVKNERRQNYENAPYGLVGQAVRAEMFPAGHPYHFLTIGSPQDLDAATLADVKGFFRTYYVPNNATLALSGDFDETKTLDLVKKYFGPIVSRPLPARPKPAPVTLSETVKIDVDADVELARAYVSWATPAFFAEGDSDLDLAARALASGKTSRLYKRLVYDLQVAQNVFASQASMELGSVFEIVATGKPGHTADELAKVIDEELATLRSKGVTQDELTRAKVSTRADSIFGIERVGARANILNTYFHYVGDADYFAKDLARSENATVATVTAAVNKYLPEKGKIVTLVTPKKGAPLAGQVTHVSRGGQK
jgi:zinc protease